jgi:hypothetical protein
MIRTILIFSLFLFSSYAAASDQQSDLGYKGGLYTGGSLASSKVDLSRDIGSFSSEGNSSNVSGLDLTVGYRKFFDASKWFVSPQASITTYFGDQAVKDTSGDKVFKVGNNLFTIGTNLGYQFKKFNIAFFLGATSFNFDYNSVPSDQDQTYKESKRKIAATIGLDLGYILNKNVELTLRSRVINNAYSKSSTYDYNGITYYYEDKATISQVLFGANYYFND